MASLNCSSDSKDATQRVFAMNALYLLITMFCSFSLNSCQTYVFSDEMCRKDSNILGISIATNTEFSESSEIVVITDRDLLYWSNSTSDHQWLKEALPWNWSASSVVIFRRNFIEELTECGKSISDFFVVKVLSDNRFQPNDTQSDPNLEFSSTQSLEFTNTIYISLDWPPNGATSVAISRRDLFQTTI